MDFGGEPTLAAGSVGSASPAEMEAMKRAISLAATPGVPHGPNPRVGCVILDEMGATVAHGYHHGAGMAHAEVEALSAAQAAGLPVVGATAVVTLEPCNHSGRTGPCARALIAAGVSRVVFGQADPNPVASGGAETLRAAGVDVVGGVLSEQAIALNSEWTVAVSRGRPFVTWKVAATLDGRVAATDGTSQWITGAAARAEVHQLRQQVQAVVVGTGTVLADDPSLTAREPSGQLLHRQPLRVVLGRRDVPQGAKLRDGTAPFVQYPSDDLAGVLEDLARREVRHVLLEGGPTLSAAFLRAGFVDRIRWYVAPAILGSGLGAIGDLGIRRIADIRRLQVVGIRQVGLDVCIDAVPEAGERA